MTLDDMDNQLIKAMDSDWTNSQADTTVLVATLVAHLGVWRSRANYWRQLPHG